jgi:hypothetical protein
MLAWLAPMALAGLAFLSVPILLHLFKPRRIRVVPFSSLRWLKASRHHLSRRIQLHQVLLFILRVVIITALVLALAQPVFSPGRGEGNAERFLIIDVSRSMAFQVPGKTRPIDRARVLTERILSGGRAGDRSAVVLAGGRQPEGLGPLVDDPRFLLGRLRALRAESTEGELTDALPTVAGLLAERRPHARVDLIFITDHQAQAWDPSSIARFLAAVPLPVTVRVVTVEPEQPENAWIASAAVQPGDGANPAATLRVTLSAVGSGTQERTVKVGNLPGLPDMSQSVSLTAHRPVTVNFKLPVGYETAGRVAVISLLPSDALASDDLYWLALDAPAAPRILILEEAGKGPESLAPAWHLKTALSVLAKDRSGWQALTVRTPGRVTREEIDRAEVILLADLPDWSGDLGARIAARVRQGAGLVVFLGPASKPAFYNDFFAQTGLSVPPLVPVRLAAKRPGAGTAELSSLAGLDWRHPLLAPLQDDTFGDLLQVKVSAWHALEIDPAGEPCRVLARANDGKPFLMESESGRGRVVLLNTSADDAWSDLPRRRIFVPLIDRLTRFAAGTLYLDEQPTIDMPLRIPIRELEPPTDVTVRDPANESLPFQLRTSAGGWEVQVDQARRPGLYTLAYRRGGVAVERIIPVQCGRRDSAWVTADSALLQRWWKPAPFKTVSSVDWERHAATESSRRFELDAWLMLLALLVLVTEFFWTHWVCPRVESGVSAQATPPETLGEILPEVIPDGLPEVLTGIGDSDSIPARKGGA